MPFVENHARLLRILGAPFTPFYAGAAAVRNFLYDKGFLKVFRFDFPVICIGNLCAGGSGKTPMTEYMVRLLSQSYRIGVVSRGYGRETSGDFLADESMDARQIGDEPMQYMRKFHGCCPHGFWLFLARRRGEGILRLKESVPGIQTVVLDDAYQHRSVRAGLYILLSQYDAPFFRDFPLPLGTLRESRSQSRRAQIIVFTKCPADMDRDRREKFLQACSLRPGQKVFFSRIVYEGIRPAARLSDPGPDSGRNGSDGEDFVPSRTLLLITGIAHTRPLEEYLSSQDYSIAAHFRFGDHHRFSEADYGQIEAEYRRLCRQKGPVTVLTTEKDLCRMDILPRFSFFSGLAYLPIRIEILFGEGAEFDRCIKDYVGRFVRPASEEAS